MIDEEVIILGEFYVLLTVYLGMILVHNQPDSQLFFMYFYFYSLHVSGVDRVAHLL